MVNEVKMAKKIGVRELKNNASKIVRAVREEGAEYVVTVHGEPVALLRPLAEEQPRKYDEAEVKRLMTELNDMADRVSQAWKSPLSAVEAVEEQRRDL
jgi:prevent-host-death family protein